MPVRQRWRRTLTRALAGAAIAIAALSGPIAGAHADGDPASDVLVGTSVFLTRDSGASVAQQAQLLAQVREAARRGHPLRVAVIARRSDLGSIGALWRQPQVYAAQVLGPELSLVFHGELLVVMPNGFGVARGGTLLHSPLDGHQPVSGKLLEATEQAVTRLTGAPAVASAPVSVLRARSATSGLGWWLASGVGALVLAVLWALSLRRVPPRLRGRHAASA